MASAVASPASFLSWFSTREALSSFAEEKTLDFTGDLRERNACALPDDERFLRRCRDREQLWAERRRPRLPLGLLSRRLLVDRERDRRLLVRSSLASDRF
mmetsp:Transcript_3678/g.7260  ORF Transcript_3678/g.7260 Transcript_3678/m.7260 type:complete len:100 (-) Transcript_3678:283-582(-)